MAGSGRMVDTTSAVHNLCACIACGRALCVDGWVDDWVFNSPKGQVEANHESPACCALKKKKYLKKVWSGLKAKALCKVLAD